MELNNYDRTAGFYDSLGRTVFFRTQINAQAAQLKFIRSGAKVLIVGGGTGWILEEIAKVHPAGLHITYIEISGKMLARAKKRNTGANNVRFVHSAMETYAEDDQYDVIQTGFLFDNFSRDRINHVFLNIHELLKSDGLWLFSDFNYHPESGKFWQGMLLKMMYFFFRNLANVEADKLIDICPWFHQKGYIAIDQQCYYQYFIKSIIFQKPGKSLPSSKI